MEGPLIASASVPQRPVRTVAAVSRHPRRFPDPISAVGELIRVLGDVDPFLTIDREGRWIDACTDVADDFAPSGWIERRVLAAGEWRVGKADGMRAEQLVERADGRPPWLVSIDELRDRRERGRARRRELRPDHADRARRPGCAASA